MVANATSLLYSLAMDKKLTKQEIEVWRLFITTHSRLISLFEARMVASNVLPLHWYDVLIELYEAPDHKLRMHELAERVVLSRSGLTRLVDNLEKAGYLKRESDANDRRGLYAAISEEGIAALRKAWPVYAELIAENFINALTEHEMDILAQVFGNILRHLSVDK